MAEVSSNEINEVITLLLVYIRAVDIYKRYQECHNYVASQELDNEGHAAYDKAMEIDDLRNQDIIRGATRCHSSPTSEPSYEDSR